jgi:glycosyltransferase involved in cell wall biosynthesis
MAARRARPVEGSTLRSLLRLDYPRYEIILIDDNTDDESLWPVEAWCARHGIRVSNSRT